MRKQPRHAIWLVLVLIGSAGLTGCYKSVGGSLEPTPVNVNVVQVANTSPIPPSFTPLVEATDVISEPTEEQMTELPSPIPPSDTPETPFVATDTEVPTQVMAQPDGQGGPTGPTETLTVTPAAIAAAASDTPTLAPPSETPIPPSATQVLPSETPIPPSATPTLVPPSSTPVPVALGPTSTFTAVPFTRLQPTPTYTLFAPAQEAQPLGERPTETQPAIVDGQGGPAEVAQVSTLSSNQATATALVYGATVTAAYIQGTVLPPPGVTQPEVQQQQPVQQQPGVIAITTTPVQPAGQCGSHLISPGETLYRIAAQYNVTVDQIVQSNGIVNPNLIEAGQTLVIPCPLPATATPIPQQTIADGQGGQAAGTGVTTGAAPGTYIVEPGDNLYQISLRYNVSLAALMSANGMTPSTINFIYAGQQLVIPGGTTTTAATGNTITITVTPATSGNVIYITVTPFQ